MWTLLFLFKCLSLIINIVIKLTIYIPLSWRTLFGLVNVFEFQIFEFSIFWVFNWRNFFVRNFENFGLFYAFFHEIIEFPNFLTFEECFRCSKFRTFVHFNNFLNIFCYIFKFSNFFLWYTTFSVRKFEFFSQFDVFGLIFEFSIYFLFENSNILTFLLFYYPKLQHY